MIDNRKYRIKEKFDAFSHQVRKDKIEEACTLLGISYDHLRRIWNYREDETSEAKPSQLIALAKFFDCTLDDLLTTPINQSA